MEKAEKKVLILVHRQEIFDQTIEKLAMFGISAGQIRTGRTLTKNPIQVGMIKTVCNLIKKQERIKEKTPSVNFIDIPDLIIGDEFHHFVSKTFLYVINHFGDVPRIGFNFCPGNE